MLCGGAGSGKSTLMRDRLLKVLIRRYGKENVWVGATTGVAANPYREDFGGNTYQSLGGLKLGHGTPQKIWDDMNKLVQKRWKTVRVFFIEESSMISGPMITLIDAIAKIARGNNLPFGGVRMFLLADFYQLPPIMGEKRNVDGSAYQFTEVELQYLFDTAAFRAADFLRVRLTHSWRTQCPDLMKLLGFLKVGNTCEECMELLERCHDNEHSPDANVTVLCPRRRDVAAENKKRLDMLPATYGNGLPNVVREFTGINRQKVDGVYNLSMCVEEFARGSRSSQVLPPVLGMNGEGRVTDYSDSFVACNVFSAKVGAKVMSIAKLGSSGVINGTFGVITGFTNKNDPLEDDLKTFLLDKPRGTTEAMVRKEWGMICPSRGWPKVAFQVSSTEVVRVIVRPHVFTKEDNDGVEMCSRLQLPLLLTYALTIHKAQGLTLEKIECRVDQLHFVGQAYVMLSRVRSIDDICLTGNVSNKKLVPVQVIAWDQSGEWVEIDNSH